MVGRSGVNRYKYLLVSMPLICICNLDGVRTPFPATEGEQSSLSDAIASANVGGGVEFSGSKSGLPPVAPNEKLRENKNENLNSIEHTDIEKSTSNVYIICKFTVQFFDTCYIFFFSIKNVLETATL